MTLVTYNDTTICADSIHDDKRVGLQLQEIHSRSNSYDVRLSSDGKRWVFHTPHCVGSWIHRPPQSTPAWLDVNAEQTHFLVRPCVRTTTVTTPLDRSLNHCCGLVATKSRQHTHSSSFTKRPYSKQYCSTSCWIAADNTMPQSSHAWDCADCRSDKDYWLRISRLFWSPIGGPHKISQSQPLIYTRYIIAYKTWSRGAFAKHLVMTICILWALRPIGSYCANNTRQWKARVGSFKRIKSIFTRTETYSIRRYTKYSVIVKKNFTLCFLVLWCCHSG